MSRRCWGAITASLILCLAACAGQPPDRAHVATSGGEVTHDTSPPVQSPPWPRSFRGQQTTTTTAPAPRATALVPPPTRDVGAQAATSPVPFNATGTVNGYPCGGDLPPCKVLYRESRGNPKAYNPTGCNGHGCYGLWQFSGAWAGRLGLPVDIANATVAQQNNAARLLWDHGRGCSNWGAC